jgi:lipopolysaccharide assembly protein A
MLTLISVVLFGILSAFFATQNASHITISLASYTFRNVPLYLVVLISLLVGLLLSSLISVVNTLSASLTIHGKDVKIKETKQSLTDLTKRIHQLELENERLKTKHDDRANDEKSL